MSGIVKEFANVTACDDVSLEVAGGEVHALLGENGAGKTTLMNILYGLVRPDRGVIEFEGRRIDPRTPGDALTAGIGMVHQHPLVVGPMSVAENLFLGGLGDGTQDGARAAIAPITKTIPLDVDLAARVDSLPMSQRQRIEIVRCLARDVRLLILDEPTAVLTPEEVEQLFIEIERLRGSGRSVIFISHKLSEVMRIADRVTVLRGGRNVGTHEAGAMTAAKLAAAMVGAATGDVTRSDGSKPGRVRLEVDACTITGRFGPPELERCTLGVRSGEIIGIAGVEGNGQRPLAELLFGLRRATSGTVRFDGRALPPVGRWQASKVPIARIPEDRRHHGLLLGAPLWQNLMLGPQPPRFGPVLARRAVLDWARTTLEEYGVRPADPTTLAANLSGGNQQKVVIARELGGAPEAVVAVNPTRGLDIRAQQEVQERLLQARGRGAAVLLISTDLDEIFALSDSIAVLYGGRITGPFAAAEIDRDRAGMLMGGVDGG
ncbi:MAG: ABC transporter ATP-binding protein [Acidobacteria bacterium]|nr:MAG: ABC transporter ATP-binding protein [Acidobacteriota bacterium]